MWYHLNMNMSIPKELEIKVITNAKAVSVEEKDGIYIVRLTSQPEKGQANKQLIKVMSDHLRIPKSRIKIKSGQTSRRKKLLVF